MEPAEPRHHTARDPRFPTRAGRVAKVAKAKGRLLMPWQRRMFDVALEYDPHTGLNRYGIVVVSVQRQSGKTTAESDLADAVCLHQQYARAWITMQNGKTADSWMRNEHLPQLRRAGVFGKPGKERAGVRYNESLRAGEVGVVWHPPIGSTFFTFPPKRDALHSKQSDLVIVDEAWAHDADTGAAIRQAVRPTMTTRPNAQLWVLSTMGDDASVYFDGYIELAKASLGVPNTRICFVDYGISDDDDPEDLDIIAAKHPAYGFTVSRQSLLDARAEFRADPTLGGAAGWARAYGNRPTRARVAAIPPVVWANAGDTLPQLPDRVRRALGFDVSPDGLSAAVGGSWRDDAGVTWLEVLHTCRPDDRELPRLLVELSLRNSCPITIDRGSLGALEVADAFTNEVRDRRLDAERVCIQFLNMAEYAQACTTLDRGLRDGTHRHTNDPDLNAAVEVATKRQLGDGWFGWGRKDSSASIAPLVAVTVAAKALDRLPAEPAKPVWRV